MRYALLLLSAAFFGFAPSLARAADAPTATFSDTQRAEIENIVKEYLTKKNPEVMIDAMKELQNRQNADAAVKSKAALSSSHDKIFNDPNSPVGGNPKGNVTVVEFFDYQCGYCKMTEPGVQKLLKEDRDVKFIYKDFPILGPMSVEAAKASLASVKQGKYIQFHDALMSIKDHLSEDLLFKAAKDAGLDVDKLKKVMNDEAIGKMVDANVTLGESIGARGTPTFVVGDQIYPGAMQYEQLKKSVDDARAAAKKQ